MHRYFSLSLCLLTTISAQHTFGQSTSGTVNITVREESSRQQIPCRLHIKDADGKSPKADGLPFFHDHFACPGSVNLSLPAGDYSYECERGPEYEMESGSFSVKNNEQTKLDLRLVRIAHLAKDGWWPGELHVHRPLEDIELLMKA